MSSEPEKPRFEPEILPPERKAPQDSYGQSGSDWKSQGASAQGYRLYVGRVSPLQMSIFAVLGFLIVAAILFLFAGFLLVAIPAIAIVVAVSFLVAVFRKSFSR